MAIRGQSRISAYLRNLPGRKLPLVWNLAVRLALPRIRKKLNQYYRSESSPIPKDTGLARRSVRYRRPRRHGFATIKIGFPSVVFYMKFNDVNQDEERVKEVVVEQLNKGLASAAFQLRGR